MSGVTRMRGREQSVLAEPRPLG
ncbi:hypothetical protein F8A90_05400 [Cobetia sp. cqz5-12]|nr:hypothetical protein F8A90_05400 [Cobetia sp. cqz5-12]